MHVYTYEYCMLPNNYWNLKLIIWGSSIGKLAGVSQNVETWPILLAFLVSSVSSCFRRK